MARRNEPKYEWLLVAALFVAIFWWAFFKVSCALVHSEDEPQTKTQQRPGRCGG